jgi:hypothetical protein
VLVTLSKLCVGLELRLSSLFEAFELGTRDETRELIDLVLCRSRQEIMLATRILHVLFDELDVMRGDAEPTE